MKKINEVIIVEGQHDIDFLSTFLDADFIKTDGTSLPMGTIKMIEELSKQGREFIILTDPDYPGKKIRDEVLKIVPNAKQGFVRKEHARTSKKVGVEHASKEEVLEAIENLISYSEKENIISYDEYRELNLDGCVDAKKRRKQIGERLHIGEANAKTFYKRLNMLNFSHEELIRKIKEILDGTHSND